MKPITQLTGASDTLLTYEISTTPSPLQVSPRGGSPSKGTITFVISCPSNLGKVTVQQIVFVLPCGDPNAPDASDLTESADGISPSVSSSGKDEWSIGPGAGVGSFVLKPTPPWGLVSNQGLAVTFSGIRISPIVGTAQIDIRETASAESSRETVRICSARVPKFPEGAYFNSFIASAPSIQNGGTVTLYWEGSEAIYELIWGTQSKDVSNVRWWTSPALDDTTTFFLKVTAQSGGQTVHHCFSITVVVSNPYGRVPPGGIIMQSGDISGYDKTGLGKPGSLYFGWAICNGNNGTSDLRDRFIVGAGRKYGFKDQGGSDSVALTVRQMPSHNHDGRTDKHEHGHYLCNVWDYEKQNEYCADFSVKAARSGDWDHRPPQEWHHVWTSGDQHSHQVTNVPAGSDEAHENRPPYFSLYFIMRLPDPSAA